MTEAGRNAEAVDVNVAGEGVHVAAAVEAGVEAVEPHDTRGDGLHGEAVVEMADGFAGFEDGAGWRAVAMLLGDAVQPERRAVRASDLADTKF